MIEKILPLNLPCCHSMIGAVTISVVVLPITLRLVERLEWYQFGLFLNNSISGAI